MGQYSCLGSLHSILGLVVSIESQFSCIAFYPLKKYDIQDSSVPYDLSLCRSFGCETLSKARAKSMYAIVSVLWFSMASVQSSNDSSRLVKVERLDTKPCCWQLNSLFKFR